MRVICIDGNFEDQELTGFLKIDKGKIYHVIDSEKHEEGDFYKLLECGADYVYWVELFLPIPDDEIDEVEIQKERETLIQYQ